MPARRLVGVLREVLADKGSLEEEDASPLRYRLAPTLRGAARTTEDQDEVEAFLRAV
jgi:hypothetical protein